MKEFERGDGGVSARFGRAGLRDTTIVGIDARDVKEKKYTSAPGIEPRSFSVATLTCFHYTTLTEALIVDEPEDETRLQF